MVPPNYDPTTDELNAAIEGIIAKGRTDYKDIQVTLKKHHPTWRLPDRRVKKFVKRQKSGKKMTEDDESVTSGPFGRYLANRRSKKASVAKGSPPAKAERVEEVKQEEKDSQLPPLASEEEPDLLKDMPAPVDYVDANDGENDSSLCVCTGCNIL